MKRSLCAAAALILGGNFSYAQDSALAALKASVPAPAVSATALSSVPRTYADGAAAAIAASSGTFTVQNCLDAAETTPFAGRELSRDNSHNLCAGSSNPRAPLACLEKALGHSIAYQYKLNLAQGVQLCGGTSEAEAPVTCLDRTVSQIIGGYSLPLEYGLKLCGGTSAPLAPLLCLDKAISPIDGAPVSLDEALKTCRSRQNAF